jgi:hypothetical protein
VTIMQGASPDATPLVPVASLEEYFRGAVESALAANHLQVDGATARYVVSLLTVYARTEDSQDPREPPAQRQPLALMLAAAAAAPGREERHFLLQRLGDVALFTAGFFADSLRGRAVGLDYYIGMGGGAYRSLASDSHAGTRAAALADVFAELAAKFLGLVDVLHEVRASAAGRDADLLRLYEHWQSTGSPRALRLLRQAGVQASPQDCGRYRH